MNKKNVIKIILSFVLILNLTNTQAATKSKTAVATKTAATTATKSSLMLLATVNIYNATSTDLGNNNYSISFQISNRNGIQSGIRYGVELINASTSEIVDTKLSDTALTLGESGSKDIKMDYSVPEYVKNGEYKLVIVSQNANGLPLAYMPAGFPEKIISVTQNVYSLGIDNCTLQVSDDASTTVKYTALQGVDILPSEKLVATCIVSNKGKVNVGDLKLSLITHKTNPFGDILSKDTINQKISINAEGTQKVVFEIPTLQNPQAYDIDIFLVNGSNAKISPSSMINYVISGASATIKNSILDKTNYKKGDIANLQLFWSSISGGSRLGNAKINLIAQAEIRDSANNICGTITKNLTNSQSSLNQENLKITINQDCNNALAIIKITDDKGNVLDSLNINLNNPIENVNIDSNANMLSHMPNINKYYVLIFILVLVLIGYGIITLKKNQNTENN